MHGRQHPIRANPFGSLIPKNGETSSTTLEALHQDAISRLSSVLLPSIASAHSKKFARLASEAADPDTRRAGNDPRRTLWGNESENLDQNSAFDIEWSFSQGEQIYTALESVLPDWYLNHNPRCQSCLNPLIRSATTRRLERNERICANCNSAVRKSEPNEQTRKKYLSVRKRNKVEAQGARGNHLEAQGEKGKRKREGSQESESVQPSKKVLLRPVDSVKHSRGQNSVEQEDQEETTRNTSDMRISPPSSAPIPTRAMSLEERAAEIKKHKSKSKARSAEEVQGSIEGSNKSQLQRRDKATSSSEPTDQRQSQDQVARHPAPAPARSSDEQVERTPQTRHEASGLHPRSDANPASSPDFDSNSKSSTASSKRSQLPNSQTSPPAAAESSTPKLPSATITNPSSSSSNRKKQARTNPKSDLKAMLARDKLRKEAEDREKAADKKSQGGLRGFLDSL